MQRDAHLQKCAIILFTPACKIMIMTSDDDGNDSFNEPRPYSRAMSRSCGAVVPFQCCKEDDEMVIVITTSSRHRSHGHIVTCITCPTECQMITLIAVVLGASLMTCM